MKHINQFNGAVTSLLTKMGLDSKLVLNACNAYRGSVKAQDGVIKSETKLSGKVTDKADGRRLSFVDNEKYKAKTEKGAVAAPGLLLALSDALTRLVESHGATVSLTEFPLEVAEWLEAKADSFKPAVAETVAAN